MKRLSLSRWLDYEAFPFSRASETRAYMKITPRVSPFLAWGDFHARSTIPEEKWGLLVVYEIVYPILIKASKYKPSSIKIHIPYTFSVEVVGRSWLILLKYRFDLSSLYMWSRPYFSSPKRFVKDWYYKAKFNDRL